jgi:hypothetical protein
MHLNSNDIWYVEFVTDGVKRTCFNLIFKNNRYRLRYKLISPLMILLRQTILNEIK